MLKRCHLFIKDIISKISSSFCKFYTKGNCYSAVKVTKHYPHTCYIAHPSTYEDMLNEDVDEYVSDGAGVLCYSNS